MKKLTKRGNKRLLNVSKSLRESQVPGFFTMRKLFHGDCTPASPIGYYILRTDLQKTFIFIDIDKIVSTTSDGASYFFQEAMKHFGINKDQYDELFSSTGCGNAETPEQAANYIEEFVKNTRTARG